MGEEALSAVRPRAGGLSRRRHNKVIVVVDELVVVVSLCPLVLSAVQFCD